MTLRRKFLLVLLPIALLPLGLVVLHDLWALRDLGRDLAERSGRTLEANLTAQVRHAIDSGAAILRHQKELVEFALLLQAREAAARLDRPPPPVEFRGEILYPTAFENREGRRPSGIKPSPLHRILGPDGKLVAQEVSYEVPVFLLAPGIEPEAVSEDLARLSTLQPAFRGLAHGREGLFYRQFVTLDSGVHVGYPGHGDYPVGYDPRERPWFRGARESGSLTWNRPVFDASSRRLAVTVSVPVMRRDGTIAGVTGIGLDALGLLDGIKDRTGLPDGAEFLLVDLAERDKGGEGIRIMVRRSDIDRDWQSLPATEWLESPDGKTLAGVRADLAAGRAGVRQLPLAGADTLWAYAPVDDFDTALLILLPVREIAQQAAVAEAAVWETARRQAIVTTLFALVMTGIALVLAVAGARAVTLPVRRLDEAARRLAAGDLDVHADVGSRDELGRLAETFNAMVPRLKDQVRLSQSLALASEVQNNLLPAAPPDFAGFDLAGASLSCDETGGDYFDFIHLPGNRLGVAVGDVTGHGVPAALLMATARGLIRARADRATGLADLLDGVNLQLAQDALAGRFMTLAILLLEAGSRRLAWANAGHEPILVFNPDGGEFSELAGEDLPLGIDGGWRFADSVTDDLATGSILVMATDGVTELRNGEGAMFGRTRLQDTVKGHAQGSASDILTAVKRKAIAFATGTPIRDDATLVVVKIR
ncbi:MAG: SpoIIE family protein phosphatase [Magnetospirillum sp. WYHS-4]